MTLYKNVKRFCEDVLSSTVISLKNIVHADLAYLNEIVNTTVTRLNQTVTSLLALLDQATVALTTRIGNLETYFLDVFQSLKVTISLHVTDDRNPHNVVLSQITQASALPPTVTQGALGDVWLEYEFGYDPVLNLSELSELDVAYIKSALVELSFADPVVALTVNGSSGTLLPAMYDTKLVSGTSGVTVASTTYQRLRKYIAPRTIDPSILPSIMINGVMKKLTLAEFAAMFMPANKSAFNPYMIAANTQYSGYTPVNYAPVFANYCSVASTGELALVAAYYLMRKIPAPVIDMNAMTDRIRFSVPGNISDLMLNLVKYLLYTDPVWKLDYGINIGGPVLGSAMMDTRLNSQRYIPSTYVAASDSYTTAYYRPYGTSVVINTYALQQS